MIRLARFAYWVCRTALVVHLARIQFGEGLARIQRKISRRARPDRHCPERQTGCHETVSRALSHLAGTNCIVVQRRELRILDRAGLRKNAAADMVN